MQRKNTRQVKKHLIVHTFEPGGGGWCGRSGGRRGRGGGCFDGEGGLPTARGGSEHPGAFEGDHGSGWGGHSAMVVEKPLEKTKMIILHFSYQQLSFIRGSRAFFKKGFFSFISPSLFSTAYYLLPVLYFMIDFLWISMFFLSNGTHKMKIRQYLSLCAAIEVITRMQKVPSHLWKVKRMKWKGC